MITRKKNSTKPTHILHHPKKMKTKYILIKNKQKIYEKFINKKTRKLYHKTDHKNHFDIVYLFYTLIHSIPFKKSN